MKEFRTGDLGGLGRSLADCTRSQICHNTITIVSVPNTKPSAGADLSAGVPEARISTSLCSDIKLGLLVWC